MKAVQFALAAAFSGSLALCAAAPAGAQLPPGVYPGEHDYKLAPSGAYALDPQHTGVIARVSHIGYGLSVFRFDKVDGALTWDQTRPANSSLSVSVDTASISTPVPGFAEELSGDGFLRTAMFPKATFVSTAVRQIDASHGQVDGTFTLMGRSHPLTFDVELIGAGQGFMGHPRLGLEAAARINPQDYGMSPMFTAPIQLVIDTEFVKGP